MPGELPHRIEAVASRDRHEHVDPAGAARLRHGLELQDVERLLHERRDLDHLLEAGPLGRVEVEHHPVGPLGAVGARCPGVHVDAAHVHHPEEGELVVDEGVVDDPLLALTGRRRERCRLDPVRDVGRRLLLEEALALPAVRVALHRERPLAQVRDENLGDVAVVGEELALRDPLLGPERLVEVRELEGALPALDLGFHRRALHGHIVANPEVDGRTEPSLARLLGVGDLGRRGRGSTQVTSDARIAGHLRRRDERRRRALERLERAANPVDLAVREPGADVPRPVEAVRLAPSEDERAELRASTRPTRVADDREVLLVAELDLPPLGRPPSRAVRAVRALGDDALEPLRPCGRRAAPRRRRRRARAGRPRRTGREAPRAAGAAPRAVARGSARRRARGGRKPSGRAARRLTGAPRSAPFRPRRGRTPRRRGPPTACVPRERRRVRRRESARSGRCRYGS